MSKGLGKLQKRILGLLEGSVKTEVYAQSRTYTTRELLEELIEQGIVSPDAPRKTAMFTVRRACKSLLNRGLIEGKYETDFDHPGAIIASWRSAAKSNRCEVE